jgi:hypothetical protein
VNQISGSDHFKISSARFKSVSIVHPFLDIDSLPVPRRKMSICKSDPTMAGSYQIGSQRLKLNAVGHVLLAFLGVFGLLSLFSNYRMFLNMLEQLIIYDDMVLTHHRQNCNPRGISAYPDNRQGDDDIRQRFDIRENFGDTQGAQSATGLPSYRSAESNTEWDLEQACHSSVRSATGTGKAG